MTFEYSDDPLNVRYFSFLFGWCLIQRALRVTDFRVVFSRNFGICYAHHLCWESKDKYSECSSTYLGTIFRRTPLRGSK